MFDLLAQLDWSVASILLFGLTFGKQDSAQQQQSQTAGPLGSGGGSELVRRNLITNLIGPDWTQGGGGLLAALQARTNAPLNYQTPQLTSTGLLQEQEVGLKQPFEQAVAQAMSRASGNFAGRGFLRPENIQAIAGSAAQNVAPSFAQLFANLAGQNVAQRTQAPLVQEDMLRQRFMDFMQALGLTSTSLGVQSQSFGRGESSGFQAGIQGSAGGGKPARLGGGSDD